MTSVSVLFPPKFSKNPHQKPIKMETDEEDSRLTQRLFREERLAKEVNHKMQQDMFFPKPPIELTETQKRLMIATHKHAATSSTFAIPLRLEDFLHTPEERVMAMAWLVSFAAVAEPGFVVRVDCPTQEMLIAFSKFVKRYMLGSYAPDAPWEDGWLRGKKSGVVGRFPLKPTRFRFCEERHERRTCWVRHYNRNGGELESSVNLGVISDAWLITKLSK